MSGNGKRSACVCLMLVLSMLFAADMLPAHQQKAAITRVLFNERSGNIEVMHRFYLHDAEHAVRELFGKDADIIKDETTRARFSNYVNERFAMRADGEALPLTPVGYEIEGRFFWVYVETAIPETLQTLSMQHRALRDIWSAQSNLVNVERRGQVRSMRFAGEADLLSIDIQTSD